MGLQAGECQCVCSLTPAGSSEAGLPAVELLEGLSNPIPLKYGIMKTLSTIKMTTTVGNTVFVWVYDQYDQSVNKLEQMTLRESYRVK